MTLMSQMMIILAAAGLLVGHGVADAQKTGAPKPAAARPLPRPHTQTVGYVPPCTDTRIDRCIQRNAPDADQGRIPKCPGHPSCRRKAGR
jgi:hypothetical protein